MFVVAVNHLLDVVVVASVVIALVSDVLPVADPVSAVGNGAGDWRDRLTPSPIIVPTIATQETVQLPVPLVPSLPPMSPWRSRLLR